MFLITVIVQVTTVRISPTPNQGLIQEQVSISTSLQCCQPSVIITETSLTSHIQPIPVPASNSSRSSVKPREAKNSSRSSVKPREAKNSSRSSVKPREAKNSSRSSVKPREAKNSSRSSVKPREAKNSSRSSVKPREAKNSSRSSVKPREAKARDHESNALAPLRDSNIIWPYKAPFKAQIFRNFCLSQASNTATLWHKSCILFPASTTCPGLLTFRLSQQPALVSLRSDSVNNLPWSPYVRTRQQPAL